MCHKVFNKIYILNNTENGKFLIVTSNLQFKLTIDLIQKENLTLTDFK